MSYCQTMLKALDDGKYNAVSCQLGSFDKSSLQTLLKIHALINIKSSVKAEKNWLNMNVPVPSKNCKPPEQHLIVKYESLLFQNTNDKVLLGKSVVASDLSSLTSNGWLTLSLMQGFAEI